MASLQIRANTADSLAKRLAMRELRSARRILRERGPSSDTLTQVEQGLGRAIDYLAGNAGPAWPLPLMDEPDLQTLQIWMEDCGCEATDGCWVEHDGVCPHGHPSWLLHMGLI